jgi:hypothetical protein
LLPGWIKRRKSRGQLAAILQIEEHPRHEPGHLICPAGRRQPRGDCPLQMIKGGNATLVVEFAHRVGYSCEAELETCPQGKGLKIL